MKSSQAANVALILVAFGWLLSAYGVLSQMGDPAPWTSPAEIDAHRRVSLAFLFGGILALFSVLWLSGYAFSLARKRATLALLVCVIPFIVIFAFSFFEIGVFKIMLQPYAQVRLLGW